MSRLKTIQRTRKNRPPFMVIYGDHGIGKTTFGASAPNPIFIATEDGQAYVDADSFGLCETSVAVTGCIKTLLEEKHDYKTCVVDSLDWLERVINKEVAERAGKASVEEIPFGVGFGTVAAEFGNIISGLGKLRDEAGMCVILLAHAEVKPVNDPTKPALDRLQIKLNKRCAAIAREAVDLVGCAYLDSVVREEGEGLRKRLRVVGKPAHMVTFDKSDAFDSKNRLGIKSPLDFTIEAVFAAIKERGQ